MMKAMADSENTPRPDDSKLEMDWDKVKYNDRWI